MPRVISALLLFATIAAAQHTGTSWKLKPFDLQAHLTHTLADAPLAASERDQIYRTIDDKNIHDSFTDAERDKEREVVLGSHVGFIALAQDGTKQILVQGPYAFCGTGGCSLWIFAQQAGKLRLILETGGGLFIVAKASSHSLYDITTGWHLSAFEEGYTDYRWNGAEYDKVRCYLVSYPRPKDNQTALTGKERPTINDCP